MINNAKSDKLEDFRSLMILIKSLTPVKTVSSDMKQIWKKPAQVALDLLTISFEKTNRNSKSSLILYKYYSAWASIKSLSGFINVIMLITVLYHKL